MVRAEINKSSTETNKTVWIYSVSVPMGGWFVSSLMALKIFFPATVMGEGYFAK